jgi:predicted membrane protein
VSTTRHIALLGGFRHAPDVATDTYLAAAAVGGVNLDLSRAELPAGGVTVTKWAVVGGLHVRVPAGCRVEVTGVTIIGRRRIDVAQGDGPVVRVRAYGLFGGVHVEG